MVSIHPTAIVDAGAALGVDVEIGPFAIVQAGAQLGDRCRLGPHVVIYGRTTLGADCQVEAGAALGGDAQDLKCDTEDTYLEIGERNVIREYVTIHRSNHAGGVTRVGSDNLLMGFVHVGHDGVLGSHIQMANLATLAGHVEVRDRVVIGGLSAIHQRVTIGEMAMVGGMTGVTQDVPPFTMCSGLPGSIRGLNIIGLRRNGLEAEARGSLKTAVRVLYGAGKHRGRALEEIEATLPETPALRQFLDFVKATRAGHNGRQMER